jgi:hypothetical protein
MNASNKVEGAEKSLTVRTYSANPVLKEQWKDLGVYRTFPLPLTPAPPFLPHVKWTHPVTKKVY